MMNDKDDFLIVVATIVAILSSKVADFILPSYEKYKIFNNGLDPWAGLIFNIIILIIITLLILAMVKFLTRKIMG